MGVRFGSFTRGVEEGEGGGGEGTKVGMRGDILFSVDVDEGLLFPVFLVGGDGSRFIYNPRIQMSLKEARTRRGKNNGILKR